MLQLADAFTAIAEVFELVSGRTAPIEHDDDAAEPIEHDDDAAEPVERTHANAELERLLGPRPRKPMPAQFRYGNDHVEAMSAQNPSLRLVKIRELVAPRWYTTSEEERQKYRDRYSALKNQYKIDIAAYNSRMQALIAAAYDIPETPDAIDEILERELGPKPKIPNHACYIFRTGAINDIREENPGILWKEAQKIAAIRWKKLSKEDCQPFRDRHNAQKKQYRIDKAAYDARKKAFLKSVGRKLHQSRDNRVANTSSTARSSQHPAPSMSPGPPPRPTERRNEPEHTTASASSGYTGLFSSQPPPLSIESVGSLSPVGSPVPSPPTLPSGTAYLPTNPSRPSLSPGLPDVVALARSLAASWSEDVTFPDGFPEPTSLPASSDGLPGPTMPIGHSTTPTPASAPTTASLTQPVITPESIPVGMRPMSLEFPEITETVAFVGSPDLSFSSDPPAPDVKPSIESAEPAELVTPKTNSKKKKKKKRTVEDDEPGADQSTSSHRKKAKRAKGDAKEGKKKKHKQRIVVKTEDGI
ncbi:hypothetical protein GGI03_007054 [Coemansia sp. RSA 2337]|nr:hypothetical protein GGI03_007054 [Coemansia sp. RSA 2337]